MHRSDVAVSDTVAAPGVSSNPRRRRRSIARLAAATTASAIAAAGLAGPALAAHPLHAKPAAKSHAAMPTSYDFTTLDNPGDPTFNQLLGINTSGEIAGYFGSGQAGHPNEAYLIGAPYTSFAAADYPGAVQTQVTGINNA